MGAVLDSVRSDMYGTRNTDGTTNYETINSSSTTAAFDVSGSENGFLIQLTYDNGVGNDVDFAIDMSIDGVGWAEHTLSIENITDSDGNIIWDFIDSNVNFVRVRWTVNSGSMDIYIQLSEKRRH